MEITDDIKVKKIVDKKEKKEKIKLIKKRKILKLSKKIRNMKLNLLKLRNWRKKNQVDIIIIMKTLLPILQKLLIRMCVL